MKSVISGEMKEFQQPSLSACPLPRWGGNRAAMSYNLQIKRHYPNRTAISDNPQIKRHYPDRGAMPDNLLV